jgi:hypothetical protein
LKILEINKYPPRLFRHARFMKEDWTACSDIEAGKVSRESYLAVETKYVTAVERFARAANVGQLLAHNVEFWDESKELLTRLGLADVLEQRVAPVENEVLSGPRLEGAIRRCVREAGWLELVCPTEFLVHFGYDFRLFIATNVDVSTAITTTKEDGLFVYPGEIHITTLDEWFAASVG